MVGVWVATLDRFGYVLLVVERTKRKALEAISREYKKEYFKVNRIFGEMPFGSEEEMVEKDEKFKELYATAMEEVYCRFLEYGMVEWTT